MKFFMPSKGTWLCEAFISLLTFIWLLFGMDHSFMWLLSDLTKWSLYCSIDICMASLWYEFIHVTSNDLTECSLDYSIDIYMVSIWYGFFHVSSSNLTEWSLYCSIDIYMSSRCDIYMSSRLVWICSWYFKLLKSL